uniref:Mitochondrial carrier protein n=1 Tax=Chlamydomonas leiostraca TaxID=1034604 RepID=A0A7S0R4T1_9CHLO|mmetsp:Transcript_13989/g.34468  ORF Transcript_13989/g.34468 Transcript_13989/m.34468 type:complete len:349 (+) Transcript_13989:203-1249(+)|eukprot:CAMPEP_0202884768 /NCGR_PEP_ID=MMETSP1391-20130828/41315_1 /ASSEMBLY_ACC=CAM_ASM_000867 /TAXON_ID=1034604 /ORGANISM="Chlamydomonas leiostraca, Strain SAG 11-49" /LENGTH=348 /DNA_ID=CAMNT_0049567999 /DNA_START=563 /DNA_END=1609 /DNA_ORIENTATION=-
MVARTINETLMEVEHTPKVHKKVLDIAPGVAGGVARVVVGQPFDTIKTRLQVMGAGTALAKQLPPSDVYLNSNDCLRKMVKNEGWISLYRGIAAPLLGNMVLLGIHFPTFTKTKKYLDEAVPTPAGEFSHAKTLAAGAAAGLAGSFVSCPSEHIRTKMQLQRRVQLAQKLGGAAAQGLEMYSGSVDCARKIMSKHGISGLYRGFTSTVMRDMQGYAWFFYGYEATIAALAPGKTKADLSYGQVMAAGVMAGFGLWGSMFPIDTIKSKMQGDNLAQPQYKSTLDCYKQSVAVEGQKGLWRGFSAAMYRAIPVNASIFLAVEGTREAIWLYDRWAQQQDATATTPATASQ